LARAGRPSASPARKPKSVSKTVSGEDVAARLIDAALAIAARDGWRAVGAAAIAAEAQVGLADVYAHVPDRAAILAGLMRRIDRAVLAEPVDLEGSPRDRLFDVLMRRFEALQAHRAGLVAVARAGVDPLRMAALLPTVARSMAWMLIAAGIDPAGVVGRLRVAGLTVVYANAFRVWLDDDGADLGKTMAALDRGLAQAERWASALPGRRPGGSEDPKSAR
jgi:AcrR family transcriptional regulator